jgi:hypothetical protein
MKEESPAFLGIKKSSTDREREREKQNNVNTREDNLCLLAYLLACSPNIIHLLTCPAANTFLLVGESLSSVVLFTLFDNLGSDCFIYYNFIYLLKPTGRQIIAEGSHFSTVIMLRKSL